MQVTQKEIAEYAGVSRATVSRVFNNPELVKSHLVNKVYKAMRELGVEINGSEISEEKRNSVLVVVNDFTYSLFASLISGVAEALNREHLTMVLCNSGGDVSVEKEYVMMACREGYVGIIFVTALDTPEYRNMLSEISIPVVMLNRKIDGINYDSVQLAHFDSAQTAVRYLQKMGHQRIALLTTKTESTNTRDEKVGFMNALVESGLSFAQAEKSVFYEDMTYADGANFANKFVREGYDFTALYILSSEQCIGFVARFQQLGKRIPDDLSLIALNRVPMLLETGTNITTLDQPSEEMGMKAVELLLKRAANHNTGYTNVQYSATLQEGFSTRKISLF
ncbi:MAG: LacI family DNA-binding transcriptional regulator [Oscillospiraceae bacterium]|nr:LacI family DNA-binding transcriptional regulator [Oscillospiraceae bacterium]MBQ4117766.1 LacI family DNA-binding transcriptional regulator [Oscillospiraceae bacterium]MBQ6701207.1 LacI family DNA-binding transcriptional regulator [Oscillospiraceae bacterium]